MPAKATFPGRFHVRLELFFQALGRRVHLGSAEDLAFGGLDGGTAGREHEAACDARGEKG